MSPLVKLDGNENDTSRATVCAEIATVTYKIAVDAGIPLSVNVTLKYLLAALAGLLELGVEITEELDDDPKPVG